MKPVSCSGLSHIEDIARVALQSPLLKGRRKTTELNQTAALASPAVSTQEAVRHLTQRTPPVRLQQ
jgi:hypothetical protein